MSFSEFPYARESAFRLASCTPSTAASQLTKLGNTPSCTATSGRLSKHKPNNNNILRKSLQTASLSHDLELIGLNGGDDD